MTKHLEWHSRKSAYADELTEIGPNRNGTGQNYEWLQKKVAQIISVVTTSCMQKFICTQAYGPFYQVGPFHHQSIWQTTSDRKSNLILVDLSK